MYRALKLHFTSNYDYILYNGKTLYREEKFNINPHRFFYERIGKKKKKEDLEHFLIANLIVNEKVWLHDLMESDAELIYTQYQKRRQSLSYLFENDCINIFEDPNRKILLSNDKGFPLILTKLLREEISLETVVILGKLMKFIPKWDKEIKDDLIWPRIKQRLVKYEAFVQYDQSKFKDILMRNINR